MFRFLPIIGLFFSLPLCSEVYSATQFEPFAGLHYTQALGQRVNLIQYSLGFSFFLESKIFGIGITSDYQIYNQDSDYDAAEGNQQGRKWNLFAPTLKAKIGRMIIRSEYQFFGDYELSRKTANNLSLHYKSPSGYRIWLLFKIFPRTSSGLVFQSVSYKYSAEGSSPNEEYGPGYDFKSLGVAGVLHF